MYVLLILMLGTVYMCDRKLVDNLASHYLFRRGTIYLSLPFLFAGLSNHFEKQGIK